jgi:histidine triad (HIT) family protein
MQSTNCVFCGIIESQEAEDFKLEGFGVVSFVPLKPVVPGHRLFVPLRHAENAGEDSMPAGAAFQDAVLWGRSQDEDFNIITSVGPNATQTIFHTHIHYVPRRENDGLMLPWTKRIGDSAWR